MYHTSFTAPDAELQAIMNKMNNIWNVDYYDRTSITQSMTSSLKYKLNIYQYVLFPLFSSICL